MQKIKISVIIPIFNVENYLRECLDSVINQTLKEIEIICINDGSTDDSLKILKEYEQKDNRITIINQKNKGAGAARNMGLNTSKGNYIYFMDSDDKLELNALNELYLLAEEKSLDIILFKLINFLENTKEKFQTEYYDMDFLRDNFKNKIFNYTHLQDKIFKIAVSPPGKLYKKSLIENIRFPENVIFEDNPFFIEALLNAKRVYFYDKYLYNRRIHKNSITQSKFEKYSDSIKISNMIINIIKTKNLFKTYSQSLYSTKINKIIMRYNMIDNNLKSEFFNKMKNDFLIHKTEYESDEDFNKIEPKIKNYFYSCINSDTHKEFDLYLSLFDYENKIKTMKKTCKIMNNEIQQLKQENNKKTNENTTLNTQIQQLKQENRKLILKYSKLKDFDRYYKHQMCLENKKLNRKNKQSKNILKFLNMIKLNLISFIVTN